MVPLHSYVLEKKPGSEKTYYVRSLEKSVCPDCKGALKVIGSRKRVLIDTDGRLTLIIRRLFCGNCRRIHHELPDIVVPRRRYSARVIETVIDNTDTAPSFPCENSTAARWKRWFAMLRKYLEIRIRALRNCPDQIGDSVNEVLLRISRNPEERKEGWFSQLVGNTVKSGLWPQTRLALDHSQ